MPSKPGGHLTFGDRTAIEDGLRGSDSLSSIASRLNVSKMTVVKEIRRNRTEETSSYMSHQTRNVCAHMGYCHAMDLCGRGCATQCRECKQALCNDVCPEFLPKECPWTLKAPYVCNDCRRRFGSYGCGFRRWFYDARIAHEKAEERKTASRSGIDCSMEDLEHLVEIVRPRILNGQSPEAVWLDCGNELPVSLRTFYNYVERGVFDSIVSLHLPKKVKIRIREKSSREAPVPRHDLTGRTLRGLPGAFLRGADERGGNGLRRGEAQREAGHPHAAVPPLQLPDHAALAREDAG